MVRNSTNVWKESARSMTQKQSLVGIITPPPPHPPTHGTLISFRVCTHYLTCRSVPDSDDLYFAWFILHVTSWFQPTHFSRQTQVRLLGIWMWAKILCLASIDRGILFFRPVCLLLTVTFVIFSTVRDRNFIFGMYTPQIMPLECQQGLWQYALDCNLCLKYKRKKKRSDSVLWQKPLPTSTEM